MNLLKDIDSPLDLKKLSINEMVLLAEEIRRTIINVMAVNGGHLASNLGTVELTLALHYVFDTPFDKLIFDTSHQTYTHKLVTGRKELFSQIRQFQGLSGFANPSESPYDHFYAGHAGTGLSLALGVAKSRDLNKEKNHVITVISDATLSCGLTLEALNNIDENQKNFLIVLNDNAMAISHAVGNIHHRVLGQFVIPREAKAESKQFFEQFGLVYYSPLDGHNLEELITTFQKAKNQNQPILIHALTIKGHGMPKAMEDPITYHGVKPFDPESGKFHPSPVTHPTFPKVFGSHLLKMADDDVDILTVTPAMPQGSCLDKFMAKYKDRAFDVGIAEGHAVTFAAGLAYQMKKKVVACVYSTFFQRALDNLFQDVCLQNIPVVFALDRSGLSDRDGTTHHGIYDIAFMNAMPNMIIAQPRDGDLLKDLLESSFNWNAPSAIRYPNMITHETNRQRIKRTPGKGEILSQGKGVAIITLGHMYKVGLEVKDLLLKEGITATVIDPIFIKPLDTSLLFGLLLEHHYFITIEEHAVNAGLGVIINNFIAKSDFDGIQVQNFGIPDTFIEQGSYVELMEEIGLTSKQIAKEILFKLTEAETNLNGVLT